MAKTTSPTTQQLHPVAQPRPEAEAMFETWQFIDTLLGGTDAMREAGTKYLPQRYMEEDGDYNVRLSTATLYPAFGMTVSKMVGRVFADPITINDDVPGWIKTEVLDNIDMQGRNVQAFARMWMTKALDKGVAYALVDAPAVEAKTRQEQIAQSLRPYVLLIDPTRVLGWREANGVLTQLRISFCETVPDGDFGVKEVEQIRVYEPGTMTTWTKVEAKEKKDQWVKGATINMGIDVIPLVPYYTKRTGFMTAEPPLLELAHLNTKHWQLQSGVDSLTDTACVPILVAYGMGTDDTSITIGAKQAIKMPQDASLEYTEHTGAAIKTGQDGLNKLEKQMESSGARLVQRDQGVKTATQAGEEANAENSMLGGMVRDFQDALALLLSMIGKYRSADKGGTITINANLDPDEQPVETMRLLIEMAAAGLLSNQTAFEEAKRRKLINSEAEWEQEQQRIKEDTKLAMELNPALPPGTEDDDPDPGKKIAPGAGNEEGE